MPAGACANSGEATSRAKNIAHLSINSYFASASRIDFTRNYEKNRLRYFVQYADRRAFSRSDGPEISALQL